MGESFGFGCGKNYDLTPDGCANWLPTIPAAMRAKVWSSTTQYKPYSWCNLAANAVLKWPNDGTAEYKYAKLPGGNIVEHVKGQCHTPDMKYPPQTQDSERNKEMNQYAKL